ncbi:LptA/OstA family protein [Sphingomicrobium sediminis]|uniref:LptA/OstA family protein n=1 Tax=Sphingomicrobium sediminis TaxID=2950949 RepID=A0A9X2EIH5_9SPHN|nr:LptA/OstA family protein [Sphingomicrobium sediminis]MCM8558157.1 LptA/OstA family protein [Sphingomicrobium sediminis]
MRAKIIIAAIGLASLTGAAVAQDPTSILRGHDVNAPVDIAADRIEVQDRNDRALFIGNVVARQGALTLSTARLRIAYSTGDGVDIDRLDASGGVTVRSGDERASGDYAIYDLNERVITLVGNVELRQGANEIYGSRLTINLVSGRAVIDGGPRGVDQSGGRVTGRFTVPQND